MGMERTFGFLTDSFGSYYDKRPVEEPPGFKNREWGFMFHGETFFRRHLGFSSPQQLHQYMVKPRPPAHVYHSAAYYDNPSAHTMMEKGWLGADLIFDLDADHLEGADKMSYPEMLDAVKVKFRTLVDNFLIDQFGYAEKDIQLVFSGSRGYHAHIRDPRVRELSSPMRRELVDYVTGKVEPANFVREAAVAQKFGHAVRSVRIPAATEGGWPGKLTRATVQQLRALASDPRPGPEKAMAFAAETGLAPREAKIFVEALSGSEAAVEKKLAAVADGLADIHAGIGAGSYRRLFTYNLGRLRGFCDEPVSSDVKRLIRAPGSLHGKTGLRAVPLTRDRLDAFDPLDEAVVLDDEPVRVTVSKPFKMKLKGQMFDLAPGPQALPKFAAVFVILRRQALLEGDTPPPPPEKKATAAPAGGTP
jgi:DNA primase small subunit